MPARLGDLGERLLHQLQRRLSPEENVWVEILKRTPAMIERAQKNVTAVRRFLKSRKFPERVVEAFLKQLEKPEPPQ